MRYREIIAAGWQAETATMQAITEAVKASHAVRIRPEIGNPTPEQQAAMPFVVECPGLTVHDLGQAFAEEFQGRRLWCRENCQGVFAMESIRPSGGRDAGRSFRFSDEADAARFRQRWC